MHHFRRSNESGFAMIEVIVSAAVLAMLALAVLSGIDGASRATGREKARSTAATVAEQDQERMRSLQIGTLSNAYDVTRHVSVDGVNYDVRSTAKWVDDGGGTAVSCSTGPQADYLQITSSVTSNTVGTRIAPVTLTSLLSPG